jgi:hypothetical protein
MSEVRRSELLRRLRQPEDAFVERTTSPDRHAVARTIVAFANSTPAGGEAFLFIGVEPDGALRGVKDADGLQRKLRRWIEDECFPPIEFTTEVLEIDAYAIVVVGVPGGQRRPFFAGHSYERRGAETVKLSRERFEGLVATQNAVAARIFDFVSQVVTVQCVGCDIDGNNVDNFLTTPYECRIEGCDAFSVQLLEVDAGRLISIPLTRIELQRDTKRHRELMLVVSRRSR